jgi:hypothetical protein
MKKFTVTGMLAGGLAAVVIGFASPAQAAPSGPDNAQQVINSLMANGYKVIINKLSDVPLDQAMVVAIRPGRPITQRTTDSGGDSIDKVLYTTVYVDVQ